MFIADEPMNKTGVYQRVEIHRWSNSSGKRRDRLSPKRSATVPVRGTEDRARREFFRGNLMRTTSTSRCTAIASSSAGRSARPMAPTTSAPRCCSNSRTGPQLKNSGTTSHSRGTAVIRGMHGSRGGYSGTDPRYRPAPMLELGRQTRGEKLEVSGAGVEDYDVIVVGGGAAGCRWRRGCRSAPRSASC